MRVFVTILVLLICYKGHAQSEPDFIEVAAGIERPTAIRHANDGSGRLFICERRGLIKILSNATADHILDRPFIDIRSKVIDGGEKGLRSMAFHPNYPYAPYVFVSYITTRSGQLYSRIERYAVVGDPNVAIAGSGRTILEFKQPKGNNNGGDIRFGKDGMLYIAVGDGGGLSDQENSAQDRSNLLGSILRINIDGDDFPNEMDKNYSIPEDNPWANVDTHKGELWAIGLRNPSTIVFDQSSGDLLISDQGQEVWEEVNVLKRESQGGENYGWSCKEGTTDVAYQPCTSLEISEAVFSYDHYEGCGIIGGAVYSGDVFPEWHGKYFASDMCSRQFWIVDTENNYSSTKFDLSEFPPIGAFGVSEGGEIYVASTRTDEDKIYRLINRAVCPGRYLAEVLGQVEEISASTTRNNSNLLKSAGGSQMKDKRFLQPMIKIQAEQNKEALMEACIEQLIVQH